MYWPVDEISKNFQVAIETLHIGSLSDCIFHFVDIGTIISKHVYICAGNPFHFTVLFFPISEYRSNARQIIAPWLPNKRNITSTVSNTIDHLLYTRSSEREKKSNKPAPNEQSAFYELQISA